MIYNSIKNTSKNIPELWSIIQTNNLKLNNNL